MGVLWVCYGWNAIGSGMIQALSDIAGRGTFVNCVMQLIKAVFHYVYAVLVMRPLENTQG